MVHGKLYKVNGDKIQHLRRSGRDYDLDVMSFHVA